jgi:hypothetical protein
MTRRKDAAMTSVPTPLPRRRRASIGAVVCALLILAGVLFAAPPASAASQGSGFGTWAPLSAHGWHGSMLIDGVHTYCIVPGLPAPTGPSTDHGIRGDAAGLSPQQLAGINHLVTTYGQTNDPVQAASVGWAVKAIADWNTTLHSWGYPGDSLAGAVDWIFSRLAPEHSAAIQQKAEAYYAEGMAVTVPGADAALTLTTDDTDPRRGTVTLEGGVGTTAALTLRNAVFVQSGTSELSGVTPGSSHEIVATAPDDTGAPFTVHAAATLSAAIAPAVRYYTTEGEQHTAGPGGGVEFSVEAADATPRPVVFSPGISTQVAAPEAAEGPFVDDVTIAPVEGVWPRAANGAFLSLRATAVVYRTDAAPTGPAIPADAAPVGELELVTDPAQGGGTYRVTSDWPLPGPGYYTAVWEISAAAQEPEVARSLERDYRWAEDFAAPTQIVHVPTPAPAPTPIPQETPRSLAATGLWDDAGPRIGAGGIAALLGGLALLAHVAQRRRLHAG